MSRIPGIARLAGVCALALSALAVGMAPADAVTSSPAVAATGSFLSESEGTITVTYSGFTSALVLLYPELDDCPDPAGSAITPDPLYAIGGINPLGASPFTIGQGTLAGSGTPIPGAGYRFCLFDVVSPGSAYLIATGAGPIYIPITSSFVTNSDGTITFTYENANPDVGQQGYLFLLSTRTVCPDFIDPTTDAGFGFQFGYGSGFGEPPASPAVIGVGTLALVVPPTSMTPVPITAGLYQVCLYQTDSTGNVTLHQSASFDLGAAVVVPDPPATPTFTG
jgi:hypothetical protein